MFRVFSPDPTLPASPERALRKLPREIHRRVARRLDSLEGDPRPAGCEKPAGNDRLDRVRCPSKCERRVALRHRGVPEAEPSGFVNLLFRLGTRHSDDPDFGGFTHSFSRKWE